MRYNLYKTTDGRDLSVGASGFTKYDTDKGSAVPIHPAPILSPDEILLHLRHLERLYDPKRLKYALTKLKDHIEAKNPHNISLDDFVEDIADILYNEYKKSNKYPCSREDYFKHLFNTIHLATSEEIEDGTNPYAILSIQGVRNAIHVHNTDPNAHAAYFENLFPGKPVTAPPVYSLYANYGISYKVCSLSDGHPDVIGSWTPYSYVGSDRYIHYCTKEEQLPVDYALGLAMIPCFGLRSNEIKNSNSFTSWLVDNGVTLLEEAESSPDRTISATAVCTGNDISSVRHYIRCSNVILDADTSKTFSIYAKAETCRYMLISFRDLQNNDLLVYGVYDLVEGNCLTLNHLNRYKADIQILNDHWYRCILSMSHPYGQVANIEVTFIREYSTTDLNSCLSFEGHQDVCGYVWGAQLEAGWGCSPYIPTHGSITYRKPVFVAIRLERDWIPKLTSTINICWKLLPIIPGNIDTVRPVFSIVTDIEGTNYPALKCWIENNNTLKLNRYLTVSGETEGVVSYHTTTVYEDIFQANNDSYQQITHSIDTREGIQTVLNRVVQYKTPITSWNVGDYLLLGTDLSKYLEGYMHHATIYPVYVSREEAIFLNGEEL